MNRTKILLKTNCFATDLKRKLVDRIDLIQVIQYEVQKWWSSSCWSVLFTGFVDFYLSVFSFCYFDFDFCCCSFGCLKVLHQSVISKEVSSSSRQTSQEGVFQFFDFYGKLVHLLSQVGLCVKKYTNKLEGWKAGFYSRLNSNPILLDQFLH